MFRSTTSTRFRTCFNKLPLDVQEAAIKQYEVFLENPFHPSLQLKRIGRFWSARVGRSYRALATLEGNVFTWFWIGSHDEYRILDR